MTLFHAFQQAFRAAFQTLLTTYLKTINSFQQPQTLKFRQKTEKRVLRTLRHTSTAFLKYQ